MVRGDPCSAVPRMLRSTLARLSVERRPVYEQLADIVVDVDDMEVDEIVGEIRRALGAS